MRGILSLGKDSCTVLLPRPSLCADDEDNIAVALSCLTFFVQESNDKYECDWMP